MTDRLISRRQDEILTAADLGRLDEEVAYLDMRGAVRAALNSGAEPEVHCATFRLRDSVQGCQAAYFPNAGRAAVCYGGDSIWVDADDIDDAISQTSGLAEIEPDDSE